MEHIVTLMVDGCKVGECVVEASQSGWDRDLAEAVQEATKEAVVTVLEREDEALRQGVASGWENLGKERRQLLTLAGKVEIRRRVYRDERGRRRKPLDEVLGLVPYRHETEGFKLMGAYLATRGTYRDAAELMSWMFGERVTRTRVQRLVWEVGEALREGEGKEREAVFGRGAEVAAGKVSTEILYGEMDGVYISLQRERKKLVEVRVGILYTGREKIGVGRYRLTDKLCVTEIVKDSEEWQEKLLLRAWQFYDLEQVRLLVLGGDGGRWVRHSVDRFAIWTVYQLDRFHLFRAARRAGPGMVPLVRRCCEEGLAAVAEAIETELRKRRGKAREKVGKLYRYMQQNVEGLVDYRLRLGLSKEEHPGLGAIEGNVDKLVVQRMKGRGKSWRLPGARAMLALCRHRQELAQLALRLPRPEPGAAPPHRQKRRPQDHGSWLQVPVPALHSSAQNRPWARYLKSVAHGEPSPLSEVARSP